VVARAKLERRQHQHLIGAVLSRITCWKRGTIKGTEYGLRIGRAELGNYVALVAFGCSARQKATAVSISADLNRNRIVARRADVLSHSSEEMFGVAQPGRVCAGDRREDKPEWWSYFNRLRMTDAELVDDTESIGELEYVGVVEEVAKSYVHRHRFDPAQKHKIAPGKDTVDPRTEKSAGEIVALDAVHGTIDLKRGKSSKAPHPRSLVPGRPLDNVPLRAALERVAQWVIDNGIDATGPYQAARDLLRGAPPRIPGLVPSAGLRREGESALDAARRLAAALDNLYLAIQGPPGSGKRFTGARMIVDLVRRGDRVGICGPSAISNLLDEAMKHATAEDIKMRAIQKAPETGRCASPQVAIAATNADVDAAMRNNAVDIVAGTGWLFAREEMADTLDALFVDEAGQVALATPSRSPARPAIWCCWVIRSNYRSH
jgi:hypothetical protein